MQRWRIGDVTITRIIETEDRSMTAAAMLPEATPANLAPLGWLRPHFVTRVRATHQQHPLPAGRESGPAHRDRHLPGQ